MSFLLLFLKSICGMILYKLKLLVISCENWCICDSLVSKITHTMDGPALKRKTCLATKFTRVTHSLCAEVCCISCITSYYIWLQVKTFFFFALVGHPICSWWITGTLFLPRGGVPMISLNTVNLSEPYFWQTQPEILPTLVPSFMYISYHILHIFLSA